MFRSLHGRLWLSYALLILTALLIVAAVLIAFLIRSPLLYRNTLSRLDAAQTALASEPPLAGNLQQVARAFDVRVLHFSAQGQLVEDTDGSQAALALPAVTLRATRVQRDAAGKPWFYSIRQLPNDTWILVAAPRPRVAPLVALLTDELSAPFVQGGAIALVLSLVVAFVLARWMTEPLEQMVAAAHTTPIDNVPRLKEEGPEEVRVLARAFNTMVDHARASRLAQRDFVANVSHELKTPLTSIQGFAQALMDGTVNTPDERQQAARVIYTEAGRMHRMALDLLELARLDAGTAEFKRGPVDLPALLRSVCDRFQPIAQAAGLTLQLAVAPGNLAKLAGDGDRLAQAFSNLIDNAIKFTPPGGSVVMRCMSDRNELQVSVSDTGRGIPTEALPHIFDRFYQADSARSGGNSRGAGLGLAIAQEVVAAHGGRITVRSAEGRGTGFVVHLPLTRDP